MDGHGRGEWRVFLGIVLVCCSYWFQEVTGDGVLLLQTKVSTTKVPATKVDRVLLDAAEKKDEAVRAVLREAGTAEEEEDRGSAGESSSGGGFRSWAEMFHWAMRNTRVGSDENASVQDGREYPVLERSSEGREGERPEIVVVAPKERESSGEKRLEYVANPVRHTASVERAPLRMVEPGETEFDIMERAVAVLRDGNAEVQDRVMALGILEDLCHSIDNGRDLSTIGGLQDMSKAAEQENDATTQKAALWAIATCTQNNPHVQEALVRLGLVQKLVSMVERRDEAEIRAKCLLALAALLDSTHGRDAFQHDTARHTAVLLASLMDTSNLRAIRRALSIAGLLLRHNQEVWAVPLLDSGFATLAEHLLETHPDTDVRENAAAFLAIVNVKIKTPSFV